MAVYCQYMKTCSKCGAEKPYSEYSKDSSKSDGYYPSCKPCKLKKDYKWAKSNPKKVAAIMKRYNQTPKGRAKAIRATKNYRQRHHDRYLAHSAVYQARKRRKNDPIIMPDNCEECNARIHPLHAHHFAGYEGKNRYKVIFLCRPCHNLAHT